MNRRLILLASIFLLSWPSLAQEPWSWPEKPENIQVLPKEWPGSRLSPVMRGFSRALGVRCSYCHVGEEGKPLSTYDFASDENPNKDRAREMLTMLGHINDDLKKIEPSGIERVNMWCHTCHRGRPRPTTLGEELVEVYNAEGMDAALSHYSELKNKFEGKGTLNFTGDHFNDLGYAALSQEETDEAIRAFQLNTFLYPEVGNAWDSLAEAYVKSGDREKAIKYFQKALALNPRNENARKMLKELEE